MVVVVGVAAAGLALFFARRAWASSSGGDEGEEGDGQEGPVSQEQEQEQEAQPAASSTMGQLVQVQGYGKKVYLQAQAAEALARLQAAARAAGFAEPLLLPVSGFRSSTKQKGLWEKALVRYGSPEEARKWVAPPGKSAHETGRAVDLWLGEAIDSSKVDELRETPVYKWLVEGAAQEHGFYPYEREPWHWEFGRPHQAGYSDEIAQLRQQGVIPE